MTDADRSTDAEIVPPHKPQPLSTPPARPEAAEEASDSPLSAGETSHARPSGEHPPAEPGGETATVSSDGPSGERTSPYVVTDDATK